MYVFMFGCGGRLLENEQLLSPVDIARLNGACPPWIHSSNNEYPP